MRPIRVWATLLPPLALISACTDARTVGSLQVEIAALEARIMQLETEQVALHQSISLLEGKIGVVETSIDLVQTQNQTISLDVGSLKKVKSEPCWITGWERHSRSV